jgi:hypothetical protein
MPAHTDPPFEIHVHGDVVLRADVSYEQLQEALRPLWKYAGARSLADGAPSVYDEEPGLRFDTTEHLLQMCWTVRGDDDFRQALDELCMSLNDISEKGASIEVTFYDTEFDEDDENASDEDSRDDFVMLFVGPTPAAIMQVQRDLLVQDVVQMMERHFDGAELGGVVAEIDRLFSQRFDALVNSLDIGKPPKGGSGGPGGAGGAHGGGRRPRHLHELAWGRKAPRNACRNALRNALSKGLRARGAARPATLQLSWLLEVSPWRCLHKTH